MLRSAVSRITNEKVLRMRLISLWHEDCKFFDIGFVDESIKKCDKCLLVRTPTKASAKILLILVLILLTSWEGYKFYLRKKEQTFLNRCKKQVTIGKVYNVIQSSSLKNGFLEVQYLYNHNNKFFRANTEEIGKIEEWNLLDTLLINKELPVVYCVDSPRVSELIFYRAQFYKYGVKLTSNYKWVERFW
jgi:hypothetical protein